jgi:hypothetical protein
MIFETKVAPLFHGEIAMHLYNGTGCLIYLIGSLTAIPVMKKNNSDTIIIVTRKRHCLENTMDKIENYRVVLNPTDAHRIMKFGFPGMTLSVRGDFRTTNNAEIIAEKIDFIDFPSANEFDYSHHKNKTAHLSLNHREMSYWFTRDGSMRKELMHVH